MKLATPFTDATDLPGLIRGNVVGCTGRLASMSHEEFVGLIESYGGTWMPTSSHECTMRLLVVGQQDWPLTRDGSLTPALQHAVPGLLGTSNAIVLSEEQFLAGLGLEGEQESVHRLYTITVLTELLAIPRERIRAWVKAGLIQPAQTTGSVWHFDFREVSAAKTLCELARSGVSTGRLRASLEQLRTWLPDADQPLHQLSLLEQDGQLLVRLEQGELAEPDGQLRLAFEVECDDSPMRLLSTGPTTAAEWAAQAVEQEQAGELAEAVHSYRQALLAGGPDARICFDLAHALHEAAEPQQSAERYRQATEIDPQFAEAWNNLGAVLCELDSSEEACEAFRRTLAIDPDNAHAHYNLADLLDEMGCEREAAEHWRAYLRHDGQSQWAGHARRRLLACH